MIIMEEDRLKEKVKKKYTKEKKYAFSFRKKVIYVGLLFLCSYMFSAVKMHEIKWQPSVNVISEYYQKNNNLIELENNEFVKDNNEMNGFLKKIDLNGQIEKIRKSKTKATPGQKIENAPTILTTALISKIYNEDFYIYKKNTQFSDIMNNYFPDNDYIKYKLIYSVNERIRFKELTPFNNSLNEKIIEYEKNMTKEQINYVNDYIKIKDETIKDLDENKKFLKRSSYVFSNFIFSIFNNDTTNEYNKIVNDFGLINGRILSEELIPKVIKLIPENEQIKINHNKNYIPITSEEFNVIEQGIRK